VARVRLIHWNGPEGRERALRLASLGHHAEFDDVEGPALLQALRASPPDAFIIDLSRLPSHGREVGLWLRSTKSTRAIPLIFVDGDPQKVARIKELLPDATYTSWGRLKASLPGAVSREVKDPVVPPSSIYSGKPVAQKLGIKSGMRVCLVNAPAGMTDLLRAAPQPPPSVSSRVTDSSPDTTSYTARASRDCDLFVVFVRARRELAVAFASVLPAVSRQTLWIAWPKKTSGLKTDLDGNLVRETGLDSGCVDFKVCAIDDTWSGLAFKRRT
jgi:hypothetical protein